MATRLDDDTLFASDHVEIRFETQVAAERAVLAMPFEFEGRVAPSGMTVRAFWVHALRARLDTLGLPHEEHAVPHRRALAA